MAHRRAPTRVILCKVCVIPRSWRPGRCTTGEAGRLGARGCLSAPWATSQGWWSSQPPAIKVLQARDLPPHAPQVTCQPCLAANCPAARLTARARRRSRPGPGRALPGPARRKGGHVQGLPADQGGQVGLARGGGRPGLPAQGAVSLASVLVPHLPPGALVLQWLRSRPAVSSRIRTQHCPCIAVSRRTTTCRWWSTSWWRSAL
jgi:hypothetical protein